MRSKAVIMGSSFHEAGHAIIWIHYGFKPVCRVFLEVEAGNLDSLRTGGNVQLFEHASDFQSIQALMGGYIAKAKYKKQKYSADAFKRSIDARDDWQQIQELLKEHPFPDREFNHHWEEAEKILESKWKDVEQLAQRLSKGQTIQL